MFDIVGGNPGTLYGFFDDQLAQRGRREILQAAAKIADRGTDSGKDVNGFCRHGLVNLLVSSFRRKPESLKVKRRVPHREIPAFAG